ncbi:MAG: hypothetical protein ACJZ9B_02410 [Coraliomargaritaceae bacterium]
MFLASIPNYVLLILKISRREESIVGIYRAGVFGELNLAMIKIKHTIKKERKASD